MSSVLPNKPTKSIFIPLFVIPPNVSRETFGGMRFKLKRCFKKRLFAFFICFPSASTARRLIAFSHSRKILVGFCLDCLVSQRLCCRCYTRLRESLAQIFFVEKVSVLYWVCTLRKNACLRFSFAFPPLQRREGLLPSLILGKSLLDFASTTLFRIGSVADAAHGFGKASHKFSLLKICANVSRETLALPFLILQNRYNFIF